MGNEGIDVPFLIWRAPKVPPAMEYSTRLKNGDGDPVYMSRIPHGVAYRLSSPSSSVLNLIVLQD